VIDFAYLKGPLIEDGAPSWEVHSWSEATAAALIEAGVDSAVVELASEHLARVAKLVDRARLGADEVCLGLEFLALPDAMLALLRVALATPRSADEVAALAVHLVDLAEHMALLVYLPELPGLTAKSDRSGGAARNVGVARHLKG
jgi:hypothetical protein